MNLPKAISQTKEVAKKFSDLGKKVLILTENPEHFQALADAYADFFADISLWSKGRSYSRYQAIILFDMADNDEVEYLFDGDVAFLVKVYNR